MLFFTAAALSALLFFLFVTIPLVGLVFGVSPVSVATALGREGFISSLLLSIYTATATALLTALLGIPLAYLMARSESRAVEILRLVMAVPLVFPPLIAGALLLNVYGRESPIGELLYSLGIQIAQSPLGIVVAQLFVASPIAVLTASAAFQGVDKNYEYVARSLGKSPSEVFFKVTLPLAWRGVAAGLVLTWMRAVGEFGATVMLAYNPKTVSIRLWEDNAIGGLSMAMPGVFVVMVISLAALAAWAWATQKAQETG